jgi:hypothetical protein
VLAHVPAQSLRDRSGPIHARPMPRIAREIETVAIVEPRPSREIAAVGELAAAAPNVEPVQRVSRELAAAAPNVEPVQRMSRELAAAAAVDVEPVQRVSRELAVANPVA